MISQIYQGTVQSFDEDGYPFVKFSNGKIVKMIRFTWLKRAYRGNPFKGVSIVQIPLALSWAITIHKSQSLTLEYVVLDLKLSFAGGQAYTGLSRCKTLNGLSLKNFNLNSILVHPKVILFYKQYEALKHLILPDESGNNDEVEKRYLEIIAKMTRGFPDKNKRGGGRRKRQRATEAPVNDSNNDWNEECPL